MPQICYGWLKAVASIAIAGYHQHENQQGKLKSSGAEPGSIAIIAFYSVSATGAASDLSACGAGGQRRRLYKNAG